MYEPFAAEVVEARIDAVPEPSSDRATTVVMTGVSESPGSIRPEIDAFRPLITAFTALVAPWAAVVTSCPPVRVGEDGYQTDVNPEALNSMRYPVGKRPARV